LQQRKYRRFANGGSRGSVNVCFAPKADKWQTFRFVRFVPQPDFMHRSNPLRLLDHLVGAGEQRRILAKLLSA
jgi:hypothetical protein